MQLYLFAREKCLRASFGATLLVFLVSVATSVASMPGGVLQDDAGADQAEKDVPKYNKPVIITFEGPISGWTVGYVKSRLNMAKKANADLVVLEIDSPGGELGATDAIVNELLAVDWAHTVAFVPKEAISGAAITCLGCDEIRIAPDALIGDVGVIFAERGADAYRYVPEKLISPLVERMKVVAEQQGHSKELVEAMIDKNKVLFVKNPNDPDLREFKLVQGNPDTKKFDSPGDGWELVPEGTIDKFLTLNGKRAVELGLAVGLSSDREVLAHQYNVDKWEKVYKYRASDTWLAVLNSPWITGAIITIALISLFVEFSAPGLGAGGLIAGLCFVLFFWSRFAGGTAGWLEVLLFVSGIIFLLCEIFVIPGWGVSGLVGIFLVFGSIYMASQDFVIPETNAQIKTATTTGLMIVTVFLVFLVAVGLISRRLGKLPVLNRLLLEPPKPMAIVENGENLKGDGKPVPQGHPDVSIGDWGVAESLLRPAGRVRFGTKSFDVTSGSDFVDPGQQVRVVAINGNRITVEKVEES